MQPNSYKSRGKRVCDPTGWFWSEKLDGMKGRWIDGKFITRSGRKIDAPDWFIELLPDFDVEGELYFGLNSFHRTGSLRSDSGRSNSNSSNSSNSSWNKVCFWIFDAVDYELTWIERQKKLESEIKETEHIRVVSWYKIKSSEHLERSFEQVIDNDGEGVVLADPWGLYADGHVDQILKYKYAKDCEAIIIDYLTDESGQRLSSFIVHPLRQEDNKPNKKITFNIGTGLKVTQRYKFSQKFPIGTTITYTYEVMGKNGKPRTPIFKGVRNDLV